MLTLDIEMYKVATACQKKASYGLATVQSTTQEAVSYHTAFLVYALPYPYFINDTACMFDGFVPLVSVDARLLNQAYTPFLFFSKDSKRTSKNTLSQRRFVMNNTTATPAPSVPQEIYYLASFQNPNATMSIKIKHQFDNERWRFVDFGIGITFLVNPENNSIAFNEVNHDKAIEIISMELKKFVQQRFNLNYSYITQNEFNIGEKIMENQIAKQPMMISEITVEKIQNLIITLPNRPPAMLARNLADIYHVTTFRLNEAVKRNSERFPSDFMFQATDEETNVLVSQSAITKESTIKSKPYLFTREGANMLSAVLQSDIAVQRSIQIMRAFSQIEQGKLQPQKELSRIEYAQRLLQAEIEREAAEKERKRVEAINKMNAPKVEAWNEFLESDGYYTLTGAFKMMKLQPNVHIRKMREDGVLYKLQRANVPYEPYIQKGYFVVKINKNEQNGKDYPQTYVTPKGLEWLKEKYAPVNRGCKMELICD